MMIRIATMVFFAGLAVYGCKEKPKDLVTRSVTVGENKCTVQQMPAAFQEGGEGDGRFDYFRLIIESRSKLMDSSHVNYVNFGMENSIRKVIDADTILPAFVQRVANGKKEKYEYIVSFEKSPEEKGFEILIDDQVFEMGKMSIKF